MDNQAMGFSLIAFALIGMPVAVAAILKRKQFAGAGWFLALCASDTLWAAFAAMVYLVPQESLAAVFQETKLAFVCSSTILLYTVALKILRNKSLNAVIFASVMVIPVITFLLGLNGAKHGLLVKNMEFVYKDGVRIAVVTDGIWFWIHCVVCYTFIILMGYLIIRQLIRLPGRYRSTALLLLFSLLIGVAASVGAILRIFPYAIDPAPFTAIIVQIMMYFALCAPSSKEILLSSREVIFEQTHNPMYILNNEQEIIDMNSVAKKVLDQMQVSNQKILNFPELFKQWKSQQHVRVMKEDDSIFTIEEENRDVHYQQVASDIYNGRGKKIGIFIEFKNITPILTLIHKLQDSAYYDNLTGLHNRNYFIKIVNEWSENNQLAGEMLPLGIVVGDVNGLKRINDTYGHAKGDLLLQLVAGELARNKPENSIAFRMGGDEFAVLVPQAQEDDLKHYITVMEEKDYQKIDEALAQTGIAISYLIKTDDQVSILESVHEADILMYQKKKDRRRS